MVMQDPERTQIASTGVLLSTEFAVALSDLRVQGPVEHVPLLLEPEGMSTLGGKQARQHLTLRPSGTGGTAVTVGWVDVVTRRAQIRTFTCLMRGHRQRFPERTFDLDERSYQEFFDAARRFLQEQGFAVEIETTPSLLPPGPPPPRSLAHGDRLSLVVIAGSLALVLLAGIAWLLLT